MRGRVWLWHGLEALGLLCVAVVGIVSALGLVAQRLTGSGVWSHLVPFAVTVLGLGLVAAGALRGWRLVQPVLAARADAAPALAALVLAGLALWAAARPGFEAQVSDVRRLIGGPIEAHRQTLAHQVFANYRRLDLKAMARDLERGQVYVAIIEEAARTYGVDADVLMGIGWAESSFDPRDSADGGRGLFQITAAPSLALTDARGRLAVEKLDLDNQRHNAFVAAATLRQYLQQMAGDPFLGLLAYNIGPRNGGLRSIMDQYGATDFVTIQPYLQNLPRDYPIRVLTGALAWRLWRAEGRLPRYEEGGNARRIQRLGVPMLQPDA
ncbi:MAG: transglycosylase SLT domain-containing protein [bacterium]|nr:transglycosylase SLT domain-containing protein [bacterium]